MENTHKEEINNPDLKESTHVNEEEKCSTSKRSCGRLDCHNKKHVVCVVGSSVIVGLILGMCITTLFHSPRMCNDGMMCEHNKHRCAHSHRMDNDLNLIEEKTTEEKTDAKTQ